MKNIGASVDAVLTQEEEEEEEKVEEIEEEVEEECIEVKNDMSFYLDEDPTYEISAVGVWHENSAGEMVGSADTYFRHVMTGQRCENVRECFDGWSEPNEESTEKWETLCQRIEEYGNLEETILDCKRVGLFEKVETGVGVSPTPENEEYEKAMCNECKKMEGKEYEEQTTQYIPENKEEIHISHAMCTYTVSFYAIGEQAIFEYTDDDGIQSYEVDRKDFLNWLTDEEEKKVLNFEREMREKLKRNKQK